MIDLKDQMIPYKKYIRKYIEANTVHLRDSFDTRFKVVEAFKSLPERPKRSYFSFFIMFLLGILTGCYIFLI